MAIKYINSKSKKYFFSHKILKIVCLCNNDLITISPFAKNGDSWFWCNMRICPISWGDPDSWLRVCTSAAMTPYLTSSYRPHLHSRSANTHPLATTSADQTSKHSCQLNYTLVSYSNLFFSNFILDNFNFLWLHDILGFHWTPVSPPTDAFHPAPLVISRILPLFSFNSWRSTVNMVMFSFWRSISIWFVKVSKFLSNSFSCFHCFPFLLRQL